MALLMQVQELQVGHLPQQEVQVVEDYLDQETYRVVVVVEHLLQVVVYLETLLQLVVLVHPDSVVNP